MENQVDLFKRKYKYAADYGVILAGYIASFFILDYLFPASALVGILTFLGLLATPVVCFRLAVQYREKAWGGYITFGQVWAFGVWLFLFASLLMSVLYYVRFEFLQPTYIRDSYNMLLTYAEKLYTREQMDTLTANGVPTTIQMIFGYLWGYLVLGALLFLFISPMVMRKKPEDTPQFPNSGKDYEPYQDNNDSNGSQS